MRSLSSVGGASLMAHVGDAVIEVSNAEVLGRFGRLTGDQITEKSPGEVVSEADRRCEEVLGPRLRALVDVPVLGEEAASADPSLLEELTRLGSYWLLDPVDGTTNFVAERTSFATMVALIIDGETVASWMWQPTSARLMTAVLGGDAWVNGERVSAAGPVGEPSEWQGAVLERFLPDAERAALEENRTRVGHVGLGQMCAGWDYPMLVAGQFSFLVYWRTLPWDHAPGVLFAQEAGCLAQRPDGSAYRPGMPGEGLVVATPKAWGTAASLVGALPG